MLRVGIGADHGGFVLKAELAVSLRAAGYEIEDYGAFHLCGSGVDASVAANKIAGVRAGLIHDVYSAHQGVEDDAINVLCLRGKAIGSALTLELIETFLHAQFSGAARHRRRLAKVQALETGDISP